MALRVIHTTTYSYSNPVSVSHTEVHLKPRADRNQTPLEHRLAVTPLPDSSIARDDYFGNAVTHFSIHNRTRPSSSPPRVWSIGIASKPCIRR